MNSMTGFGEARVENSRHRISATIRSVNHRYLDLVVRLPEELRSAESAVGEVVRGRLARGRVEIRLSVEGLADREVEVELREDILRELLAKLETLRSEGLLEGSVTVADLVRFPQVLTLSETPQSWDEQDEKLLVDSVDGALLQLESARGHEGENLRLVLLARIDGLEARVSSLESRRGEVQDRALVSLRERVAEMLGGSSVPEERLAQEAVLLVERSDVREELDRLAGHLEHFRALSDGEGPHGRRLEFLVQELQRELNTLGGKCRDAEMTHDVVEGKLLCEQLREQLLNVE